MHDSRWSDTVNYRCSCIFLINYPCWGARLKHERNTKQVQRPRVIIICCHIISNRMINILSTGFGQEAITTICRQIHILVINNSYKLLNMSRVQLVLVLMKDGECESGLLIWTRWHGNTVGGKSKRMSCKGHVKKNFICIENSENVPSATKVFSSKVDQLWTTVSGMLNNICESGQHGAHEYENRRFRGLLVISVKR